ncbi:PD-(D/E)XK nuclease family protein [Halococcus sediminicola]|uniref:hypothetical protein n=1 Tax=Halococcus sediminicola TaxID=1264579 RepID=UPI0012AC237C|nr:hypothetical protein [Halococcus sediminicola]
MSEYDIALSGKLYEYPFLSTDIGDQIAPLYANLAEEYGIDNVLVVKRFPTETDDIAESLGNAIEGIERPNVVGLSAHAIHTLEELPNPPRQLDITESSLLLSSFIKRRNWTTEYLERASERDSFEFDVERLVQEATWQGNVINTDDPVLAELAKVNDTYHEWLADADLLPSPGTFSYLLDALADTDLQNRVQETYDAVLALEFEEFTAIDRAYLARITHDCELICVAERDSAIQRTWNEPGRISDYTPDLHTTTEQGTTPRTTPAAIADFLATGDTAGEPDDGLATVIEATTFEEQVGTVGEEIERLHRVEDIPYDEMAVVLRDSNSRIPETLRLLRTTGIPVRSATVSGLEQDPAARELYALTSWCLETVGTTVGEGDVGWSTDRARTVLSARVPDLSNETLAEIAECGRNESLTAALDMWLLRSNLKHRTAANEDPFQAKSQFEHVDTVRSLAQTLDDSDLLDATWESLGRGLEREMQRATSDKIATELELPEGGVLVDAARVLKNTSKEAVFLLSVVDQEYPADPQLNSLFPPPVIEQLEEYPAFTTPDSSDVRRTFEYAREEITRPLHAYYAALSRRMLAIGARAATTNLYFGTYREDRTGSGRNHQQSRFLDAVEDTFGELDRLDHDDIHTHGRAVRFSLNRVDDAFENVRRAGLVRDPVDLDALEADFAGVQELLQADPPEDLSDAIEARVDFAEGVVRRE